MAIRATLTLSPKSNDPAVIAAFKATQFPAWLEDAWKDMLFNVEEADVHGPINDEIYTHRRDRIATDIGVDGKDIDSVLAFADSGVWTDQGGYHDGTADVVAQLLQQHYQRLDFLVQREGLRRRGLLLSYRGVLIVCRFQLAGPELVVAPGDHDQLIMHIGTSRTVITGGTVEPAVRATCSLLDVGLSVRWEQPPLKDAKYRVTLAYEGEPPAFRESEWSHSSVVDPLSVPISSDWPQIYEARARLAREDPEQAMLSELDRHSHIRLLPFATDIDQKERDFRLWAFRL